MNGEQSVRRSGRQTSETKFFVPHFDASYATPWPSPKTSTEKAEATNSRINFKDMPKSDRSSKKRGLTKQNLNESANIRTLEPWKILEFPSTYQIII